MFSFELDTFQIKAIQALKDNKHALITAHTGSGKTVPAEFAIHYFTSELQKRVIYTSPIKSLSNQKYYEFTKQFPSIQFGILTGDIKFNPDADVLIMTTEILRNILFHQHKNKDNKEMRIGNISFDLSLDTIGCVIFDEVHYINDEQRGKVWEESIMNMPQNIQMLMLSATIDRAECFSKWVSSVSKRDVVICSTTKRVVPLTHYSMISIKESHIRKIDKQSSQKLPIERNHKLIPIKKPNQTYREEVVNKVKNILYERSRLHMGNNIGNISYVLNDTIKILRDTDKLPAICFVFSRKKAEEYANCIEYNLHDTDNPCDDTKKTTNVHKECRQIIAKLYNKEEYLNNVEYQQTLSLLEKGIAVHHSGILPILREMIELLFSKGYIKLLFATETFAVGINMPTKTVLFTSLRKYDGVQERILYPHEYTQMAGRAGRRGLDTVGYVIHLHSLFEPLSHTEYRHLLSGKAQSLKSKFSIDFSLVMRCLGMNIQSADDFINYYRTSMYSCEINKQIDYFNSSLLELYTEERTYRKILKLDDADISKIVDEYLDVQNKLSLPIQHKQKKKFELHILNLKRDLEKIYDIQENTFMQIEEYFSNCKEIQNTIQQIETCKQYFMDETNIRLCILKTYGFVNEENKLTKKGLFASSLQETNGFMWGELYVKGLLHKLTTKSCIQLLSCFTDIRVKESFKIHTYTGDDANLSTCLTNMNENERFYYDIECKAIGYVCDEDYYYHYDLIEYMDLWFDADTEEKTKRILSDAKQYDIFQGEFVKAILKINAIAEEIESFCDTVNDLELKSIVHSIPVKTLKYIATNQSLYI